ncbi:MAG: hypothetical protein ISR44_03710 [Rhodospirillales bacterium]|nr:hypothetical protein [Rhodospirillales bacterium]
MVQQIELGDDFLSEETFAAVGRLTIAFGQLDYILQITVKRLLQKSFGEGMAQAERLETINALKGRSTELFGLRVMDQASEAKFDKLIEKISGLYKKRQSVIHGFWGKDNQGQVVRIWKRKFQSTNLNDLGHLYEAVKQAVRELDTITRL